MSVNGAAAETQMSERESEETHQNSKKKKSITHRNGRLGQGSDIVDENGGD